MTKISVIIPTYNRSKYLSRAINSALIQTYKNLEIIVIDDGSTDQTKDLIENFIKNDNRIKYFYQDNSGGPACPRNLGIKNATGEFVAFLDSDDEWLPEKLEKQLYVFYNNKNSNLGFVGCNVNIIDNFKNKKEFKIKYKGEIYTKILNGNFILSCTNILVKKDVLIQVGDFDTKLKYLDDWDMWLRIAQKRYLFDFVDIPLFNYYIHEENITKNFNELQILLETEAVLEKHNEFKKSSKLLCNIGLQFLKNKKYLESKNYLKRAICLKPKNLKIIILYLFANLGYAGYLIVKILVYIKKIFNNLYA